MAAISPPQPQRKRKFETMHGHTHIRTQVTVSGAATLNHTRIYVRIWIMAHKLSLKMPRKLYLIIIVRHGAMVDYNLCVRQSQSQSHAHNTKHNWYTTTSQHLNCKTQNTSHFMCSAALYGDHGEHGMGEIENWKMYNTKFAFVRSFVWRWRRPRPRPRYIVICVRMLWPRFVLCNGTRRHSTLFSREFPKRNYDAHDREQSDHKQTVYTSQQ